MKFTRANKPHKAQHKAETRNRSAMVVLAWVLVVAWAIFIFAMSANSGTALSEELGFFSQVYQDLKTFIQHNLGINPDIINSTAHFFEYLTLGILLANALRHHLPFRKACLVAIVCASVYGITDEFHQYFVPDRMSDPVDWLIDTLGASAGVGVFALIYFRVCRCDAIMVNNDAPMSSDCAKKQTKQ